MKQIVKKVVVFFLLVSFTIPSVPATAAPSASQVSSQCKLYLEQQKLWMDHVSWTRSYIVSAIASLKDQNDVLQRLLKNQDEIGNSIKPYYGEEAGNKLAALLREHIQLAGNVLEAAKTNNKSDLDKYNKLWFQNADQIAAFLSSANPNLSEKELKDMLYAHLQFVTDQVVARLQGNWKADIDTYNQGETHMIHFADILAEAIIKQFPEKFK